MNSDLVWHTEKRKLSDLKPFPNNPRQATEKQVEDLTKSIEKFNLVDLPTINLDNTLIGGNLRNQIYLKKGIDEIEVRVPNRLLTPEEASELNLRLNANHGEFDMDLIANLDTNLLLDVGFTNFDLCLPEVDAIEVEQPIRRKVKKCPKCGAVVGV